MINKNEKNTNIQNREKKKIEKKELYDKIFIETDSILNKKYIIDYLQSSQEYNNTFELYYSHSNIDFYITKLPSIEEKNIIEEQTEKTEKVKKPKKPKIEKTDDEIQKIQRSKLKKKLKDKLKNMTPEKLEKLEKLEEHIKDNFLKLFKFIGSDQCADKSYKSEHFMKKPEIIDIIKKSKEIEKRLPDNYKTLSKQDLCTELYKL